MIKEEDRSIYLKMHYKDFLIKMEELIKSKVEIYNHHYEKPLKVISSDSKTYSYILEREGKKELEHRKWDEIDYMRFRNSFKFKDGFIV